MTSFFKTHFPQAVLVLVLVLYFFFGLQHLGKFITADEHYWVYERIPQYWNAIAEGKWKKTFINDKPGVSVALVSGIGYFFYPNASEHCIEQNDKIIDCQEKITESLYKTFRLPILLINGLLMIFLFFLIKKISDQWVALWTIILTSLSPILLGISQIINPDSLIWSFGSVGIFSFFIFLQEKKFHHLIITAVFTGLAILSKYSALILFPFYVILAVLFLCIIKNDSQFLSPRKILPFFFSAFTAIIFGSFILISFFLPALILNYKYLNLFLSTIPHKGMFFTLGAIFFLIFIIDMVFLKSSLFLIVRKHCQRYLSSLKSIPLFLALLLLIIIVLRVAMSEWDIFTRIPFDIKNFENARYYGVSVNFFKSFILEWNPLVFSLTPIMFLGVWVFLIGSLNEKNSWHIFFSSAIPILAIFYLLIFLLADVLVTPRYSILLYPLFAFLSALGFSKLASFFKKYQFTNSIITLIIFTGSFYSLVNIQPFYFNYANFLLPKHSLISDSWGYGGYEAARYLNNLPNAKNLTAWSDYYGVCEFFVGKCLMAYTFDPQIIKPDYYVLTRRGQIRYMSRYDRWEEKSELVAYKYYNIPNPDWQLFIDGRSENFVKVVKVNNEK